MAPENNGLIGELLGKYEHQAQVRWEFLTEEEKREWAWLAGIIDGEGCVSVKRRRDKKTGSLHYDLRLIVQMTHEPTIKNIKRITSVGRISTRSWQKPEWRLVYTWECGDRTAVSVLRCCLPYLVTKRAQAILGMEFAEGQEQGWPPSLAELRKRDSIIQAISLLNKRGV